MGLWPRQPILFAGYRHFPRFVGHGIHYGATFLEAQLCEGEEVIVVGGGNCRAEKLKQKSAAPPGVGWAPKQ